MHLINRRRLWREENTSLARDAGLPRRFVHAEERSEAMSTYSFKTGGPLVAGANTITVQVPSGLVDRIEFSATCGARVRQLFHGAKNLLTAGETWAIEIYPKTDLKFDPSEKFDSYLDTTLYVEADAPGELVVCFYRTENQERTRP